MSQAEDEGLARVMGEGDLIKLDAASAGRALTTRCLSPPGLHELKHAVPSLSLSRRENREERWICPFLAYPIWSKQNVKTRASATDTAVAGRPTRRQPPYVIPQTQVICAGKS